MSTISQLPDSTTKLLGSPLVITTPVSLVKELLDNAIDAKATSIEVQISPDTVSKVEVRDNGVGVHSDDYDSLGRHGHTSKIRTFEELRTHGCKTLGFRGEALAAANTLGKVTVTTKTPGDPVGASLQLVSDTGGVARQQKASVPVGTTVRITELFSRIPVREQVAIRESSKTLDKIRDLLKTYAMARPGLKLTLKVLQNPKQSWSYSPKKTAGVKEAVLQIAGKEVAAHCIEKTLHVDESDPVNGDGYTFEAYVMDPNADPYKVQRHHYFSVDGRPVSTRKGAMKKILDAYVKVVHDKLEDTHSSGRQKGYFIRLNIVCPVGSYDANVEPSKDEVLFVDEKYLLATLERLWKDIYQHSEVPEPKGLNETDAGVDSGSDVCKGFHLTSPSGQTVAEKPEAHITASSNPAGDISLLDSRLGVDNRTAPPAHTPRDRQVLSREHLQGEEPTAVVLEPMAMSAMCSNAALQSTIDRCSTKDTSSPKRKADMSMGLNAYVDDTQRVKLRPTCDALDIEEDTDELGDMPMQNFNPWVITKMTAPLCLQESGGTISDAAEQMPMPPNRVFSPLTPEPPILRHLGAPPGDLDLPPNQRLHRAVDNHHRGGGVPGGPYRSPMSSPLGAFSQGLAKAPGQHSMILRHRRPQPPWTPPSSVTKGERQAPVRRNPDRSPDGLEQTKISFGGKRADEGGYRKREHELTTHRQLAQPHNNDSSCTQDEFRTIFSTARQHLNQQDPQPSDSTSNNQRSETRKPFRQLRSTSIQLNAQPTVTDKEPIKTTIPAGDPRAYLLRRQKSICAEAKSGGKPRFRRLKSSMLPLENTPDEYQTHFLLTNSKCNVQKLYAIVHQVQGFDKYIIEGGLEDAIDMDLSEGRRVESLLKILLSKHAEDGVDAANDVELDLGTLLKGKGRASGFDI